MIERETEHAKKGMPAQIVAKMNSLCDPEIIAGTVSMHPPAGVQIDLI